MAYETALTIAEVMQNIFSNKYLLPSIQREFEWDVNRIEALFDSLMQGYPIGSFLFWEVRKERLNDYHFYEFLKNYHERDSRHNERADLSGATEGKTAILDGQQRLTSLYIGLKGSYAYRTKYRKSSKDDSYPKRKLYLNLLSEPKEDDNEDGNRYYFKFLTKDEVKNDADNYWFEVGKILDTESKKINSYIKNNVRPFLVDCSDEKSETKEEFACETLTRLSEVICKDGIISYYREKSEELDKVLNIFVRVNSGGKVLKYSDLLLSTVSAQWKNDAREEIIKFVEELNKIGDGFNASKDFVLKSALVLTDLDVAFKVDNFNKSNMKKIEDNWKTIQQALRLTFKLVSSFGYSGETLTTYNALIPIAYYLMTIGLPNNFVASGNENIKANRKKIQKWLIRSVLKKAFSGQPDNVIRPIRDILRENGNNDFPIDKIIKKFEHKPKSIEFSEGDIEYLLEQLKYGEKSTLSILTLLYPSLNFSNKFHEDHIYPKSRLEDKKYLKTMGISDSELDKYKAYMNNICNLQLLEATLNEEKSNTDFDVWFDKICKTEKDKSDYCKKHYLPDNMNYTYESFFDFLEKRKALLKSELEKILL